MLDLLETRHPDIRHAIRHVFAASPLTIRDFYHAPRGSMYGFSKNCHDIVRSQVPVVTKVRNLLLTGQCVGLHGICGVPLNAITTAEAIVGRNTIVRRL